MSEEQIRDNGRDYVGEIVTAKCESVDDKRIVLKFDET